MQMSRKDQISTASGRLKMLNPRQHPCVYCVEIMFTFFLWCVLLVICWPLALLALFLYPVVWLLLLPFRIVGITVGGILELVRAVIFLPARVLRGRA